VLPNPRHNGGAAATCSRRPAVFCHDAVLRSRFEVILISPVFRCRLRARLRNR
jgi:hypothetical protein